MRFDYRASPRSLSDSVLFCELLCLLFSSFRCFVFASISRKHSPRVLDEKKWRRKKKKKKSLIRIVTSSLSIWRGGPTFKWLLQDIWSDEEVRVEEQLAQQRPSWNTNANRQTYQSLFEVECKRKIIQFRFCFMNTRKCELHGNPPLQSSPRY